LLFAAPPSIRGADTASRKACWSAAIGDDDCVGGVACGSGVDCDTTTCCNFGCRFSIPRGFFNPPNARITSCPLFVFGLYKLLAAMTTPDILARQIHRVQKSAGKAGIPVDSGEAMANLGIP
jgi:hypothetical protein